MVFSISACIFSSLFTSCTATPAVETVPAPRTYAHGIGGATFLIGGIAAVAMLPSPLWFTGLDLVFAYLPMAWLGYRLAARGQPPA